MRTVARGWALAGVAALAAGGAAAQGATTPAAQRMAQFIEAVNTGSEAAARVFVREAYAPDFLGVAPEEFHARYLLRLYGSEGLRSGPVQTSDPQRATVAVTNELTQEIDSLVVRVEAAPPHRIVGVGYRAGAGGSSVVRADLGTDTERAEDLRRYVRRLAAADAFSGVVLLAKNGEPLMLEAVGIANRDFGAPVRADTRFNLGSANKNFTAIVIAQLVEEGRLSWHDPLSKFVPDFPDSASARTIQIEHLLTHTAGLGSYFNERFTLGSRARFRTVDDFMELARPDSLGFEPGTAWSYSNTGYIVLGKVIEVVEGRSYFDVVRERIYEPLGMTLSGSFELDRVNPNLAVGYTREIGPGGTEYRNNLFEHVIRGGPAGGGYSTAGDMLRYAEALRTGKLIRPEILELMRTPKPELGSPRYGYGFVLFEGPEIWGHGGDFPGIDFDLNQYGDSGYTLIILANYDGVNGPILRRVRAMLQQSGAIAER